MGFTFSDKLIRNNQIVFIYEECALSGVCRIAGRIRDDIGKVFGARPIGVEYANFRDTAEFFEYPVFFGTVGNSAILDKLAASSYIDLFSIAGEREVYMIKVIDGLEFDSFSFESAIVIAGSDTLGTIYGLYRLSEMIGIPALADWMDISPKRLEKLTLDSVSSVVAKAPSAARRGFSVEDDAQALLENCDKYIELLSIKTPSRETLVKQLSGGNQQKVILARWLATNPDFLILDEPTRGIDVGTKTEIQKLVLELAKEGKSIMFISSEISEMLRTCSRMIIMRDGEKVDELDGDLTEERVMKSIAGGDNK